MASLAGPSRLSQVNGLATAALAALPVWLRLAAEPGLARGAPFAAWALSFSLFVVAFALAAGPGAERRPPRANLGLLAVQAAAVPAMALALPNGFVGVFLVILAAESAAMLGPGAASALAAGETAAVALALGRVEAPLEVATLIGVFAGFQLFAVVASATAVREARARQELTRVNAELTATRQALAEASREAERLRIARELHDVLGHHLTALALQLEAARHAPTPQGAAERVAKAQEIARQTLAEVRGLVSALREGDGVDLAEALTALARGFERPRIEVRLPSAPVLAGPERAHALLRCAQELLTNAVRHAGAETVRLAVAEAGGGLELEVRDDGRGACAPVVEGHGLAGIRERLNLLGGSLRLATEPGGGFAATAWLPAAGKEGPG